jgi:hypothetical protein
MEVDLKKFQNTLPYASELYGVYQPLIGWRSQVTDDRISAGRNLARAAALKNLISRFTPNTVVSGGADPNDVKFTVGIGQLSSSPNADPSAPSSSLLVQKVLANVKQSGTNGLEAWKNGTSRAAVERAIKSVQQDIAQELRISSSLLALPSSQAATNPGAPTPPSLQSNHRDLTTVLNRESVIAGVLTHLSDQGQLDLARALFTPSLTSRANDGIVNFLRYCDPRESDLTHAIISPIGIVHLFRQYFFEFDTFLGPSVQHLWLSPGGTIELIEVNTRKTTIERTTEALSEMIEKTDKSATSQDELSDAVKQENSSNTKLGVSVNTSTQFGNKAIFTSQVSTGTNFNFEQQQKDAREQTHKGLRQQTEKLSTEIRKSYKTTFKTVSETTDVTSRRYVIQNTTNALINYELRRKMRQVGVQVQDYGNYLSWQTFVDGPGDQLGVAKLVHIAQPPDTKNIPQPQLIPQPEPYTEEQQGTYEWPVDGGYTNVDIRTFTLTPKFGYIIDPLQSSQTVEWTSPNFADAKVTYNLTTNVAVVHLNQGHAKIGDRLPYRFLVRYGPAGDLINSINKTNADNLSKYDEAVRRATLDAFFQAARDRVKLASNIQPRSFDDLREEERVIVYRALVRQLLERLGVDAAEPRIRHIFAELVKTMFDVDKMLYFVAPEWWVPRPLTGSPQQSPENVLNDPAIVTQFDDQDVTSWGGVKESARPDNYYITDDSAPARMGSSLGWLLQLDGDNSRNAFLNAPWVKAVVPIIPGQEWRALEWLSSGIEGSEGLDATYEPDSENERARMLATLRQYFSDPSISDLTVRDAINYLIIRIQQKFQASKQKLANSSSLPEDKVFEHGFDPLANGFQAEPSKDNPFEVFDQWIEVLPTDQIVPVEVKYDPKTGMQI